jgi:hypothetical protein
MSKTILWERKRLLASYCRPQPFSAASDATYGKWTAFAVSSITPALLFSTNRQFKNFYKMKHVTIVISGMFRFMND